MTGETKAAQGERRSDAANLKLLSSNEDVTDDVLADTESVFDGWYADAPRIDWDDFIDRLVKGARYDIEDMASPAVAKIQRHVRGLRNA